MRHMLCCSSANLQLKAVAYSRHGKVISILVETLTYHRDIPKDEGGD